MIKLWKFFSLIRWKNLLILAATMYAFRYLVLKSLLDNFYVIENGQAKHLPIIELMLPAYLFLFLVLANVFIAAAGYIINDYFDVKIDKVNRPDRLIIDKYISKASALNIYYAFSFAGILSGMFVSWKIGVTSFALIFLLASGLLWFYSTTYKKQALIGNIIVALLVALAPMQVAIFEVPVLTEEFRSLLNYYESNFHMLFYWGLAFSFFAFLSNLIREIVKDMEDFEGDHALGGNTLPILIGIKNTKIISIALVVVLLASLWWSFASFLRDALSLQYFLMGISLPYLYVLVRIWKASSVKDFHAISVANKLIMLVGISYSFVVYYILNFS